MTTDTPAVGSGPHTEAGRRMLDELGTYIDGGSRGRHWPLHSILAIEAEAAATPTPFRHATDCNCIGPCVPNATPPTLDVPTLGRAIHRVFRHGLHGSGADDGDGDLAAAILDEYARLSGVSAMVSR